MIYPSDENFPGCEKEGKAGYILHKNGIRFHIRYQKKNPAIAVYAFYKGEEILRAGRLLNNKKPKNLTAFAYGFARIELLKELHKWLEIAENLEETQ